MKSAIFQDQGLAGLNHGSRKQPPPPIQKKWPHTSSPLASPAAPPCSLPTWNLDDMLSTYTASGVLPLPLSPTLPPRFTLKDTNGYSRKRESSSDEEIDTDSLPLSLLSPTLPSIFKDLESHANCPDLPQKHTQERGQEQKPNTIAPLAHPLPEKPATVLSVLQGPPKAAKTGRVRWVEKRDDPSKPRFLLRVCFSSLLRLSKLVNNSNNANSSNNANNPTTVPQCLAISGLSETLASRAISQWPRPYMNFLTRYTKLAKENSLLAIAAQFDWLLCSAIVCDSSSRGTAITASSNDDAWAGLLGEIPHFVHRIERFIKANNVSDKKKAFLSFLVGILAVWKALLLKRINAVLSAKIDVISQKDASLESKQRKVELQGQIIQNYRKMEEHLAESQSFFKNSPSPSTVCPKAWFSRAQSMVKPHGSPMAPISDAYFLPLGIYSDLREACAFLYGCLKEFSEAFEIELPGGGRYLLQSGQRARPTQE